MCVSECVHVYSQQKCLSLYLLASETLLCASFHPPASAISVQIWLVWIVVSIPPLLAHQIPSVFCPHPLQFKHLKYSRRLRLAHFSSRFIHSLLCLPLPWVAVNTHLLHSWGWASRNNFHCLFLLGEREGWEEELYIDRTSPCSSAWLQIWSKPPECWGDGAAKVPLLHSWKGMLFTDSFFSG